MSEETSSADSTPRPAGFAPTRWTLVLRARGESAAAQAALSELCESYYAPVLAFVRCTVRDEEAARDLTHEFFARLLAQHGLDTVEPGRGRFRSFLLGAVKHFLANQLDRMQAQKRGGGQAPISIDAGDAAHTTTTTLQIPDPAGPAPDALFDRQWALTITGRALDTLAAEFNAADKAQQFETLKPWLLGDVESVSQAEAAARLGLSEGAVKVAVHRLRRRFRELVRTEIAQTVADPNHVQEELRYLVEVLAQPDT
ncbi:MAG TPA: sigma-70 family RNA polymerase sigma factor [Candidatus Paceibacterota bacterium]|nr:sigma-70 family RNA polymerase sigma factor [Verrucomicrobiota bacterium]HSA10152.1 sigma-70 family RNA polymerase sigma factor [Candidatus Paceibacterota bacterium]